MTELLLFSHLFILKVCCYQGNSFRSKQKEQDKRSCFKGSKVHIRLPDVTVGCLITIQAGHLLKQSDEPSFYTSTIIVSFTIDKFVS